MGAAVAGLGQIAGGLAAQALVGDQEKPAMVTEQQQAVSNTDSYNYGDNQSQSSAAQGSYGYGTNVSQSQSQQEGYQGSTSSGYQTSSSNQSAGGLTQSTGKQAQLTPTSEGFAAGADIYDAYGQLAVQSLLTQSGVGTAQASPMYAGAYAAYDSLLDSMGIPRYNIGSQAFAASEEYNKQYDLAKQQYESGAQAFQANENLRRQEFDSAEASRRSAYDQQIADSKAAYDQKASAYDQQIADSKAAYDQQVSQYNIDMDAYNKQKLMYDKYGNVNLPSNFPRLVTKPTAPTAPGPYVELDPYSTTNPYVAPDPYTAQEFQAGSYQGQAPGERQQFDYSLTDPNVQRQQAIDAVTNTPGYQFGLSEGLKSIERSEASKGVLQTSGTLQSLQKYASDYATNKFQDYQQQLSGIASLGTNLMTSMNANNLTAASSSSDIYQNIANQLKDLTLGGTQGWNVSPVLSESQGLNYSGGSSQSIGENQSQSYGENASSSGAFNFAANENTSNSASQSQALSHQEGQNVNDSKSIGVKFAQAVPAGQDLLGTEKITATP